ncbi:tight junction protein ZO-1-like isoform X2 [Gigantopelta aegis]|uniref:tight junction protein ZO-1-like isoform X2 n=1 Tax=Gigantopelta aegis TaxID=1735272 RepID=UPI001B88A2B7|nr:tight junction protein ZO-1-like isoform X2 [Gigantopelta aegis]
MAALSGVCRLIERHRSKLVKELDVESILPRLVRQGVFSKSEESEIVAISNAHKRTDFFLDTLSRKGLEAFQVYCAALEDFAPHLLTMFLLETSEAEGDESKPTQALQLGFELALKERDAVLREKSKAVEERDVAIRHLQQLKSERDLAIASLEDLAGKLPKSGNIPKNDSSPSLKKRSTSPGRKHRAAVAMERDDLVIENGDNIRWETKEVVLTKAPMFGFGIAVSGGTDSPHFANGDPSIAISDVLRAGPAEGKLQVNDRIVSVNSISLEYVDHATAISVLRDCGNKVHLIIRRRMIVPNHTESDSPPFKITLNKKNKKDEFGIVLGCKFYIREVQGHSLAAYDGSIKEGDTVLKINNTPVDNLSLVEARKVLEKTKDKLQLIVIKRKHDDKHKHVHNSPQKEDHTPGYDTLRRQQDREDVNIYRPSVRSEEDIFTPGSLPTSVPPGAYPNSEHVQYDGRYVYDNEAPPRPPLPSAFNDNPEMAPSPSRNEEFYSPKKDGYYGDRETVQQGQETRLDYDDTRVADEVFVHEERYVGKRLDMRTDPRRVSFVKDKTMGLGLRLAGGNATGIFIASVQPGTAAEAEGLIEGDQIVMANERDMLGLTREEAVSHLTSLEGQVTLIVQYRKEEYDRIMASMEAGDSFYIKTHFSMVGTEQGEHSFAVNDIFHVKDTLFRGVGGSWLAIKLSPNNQETKKGTIPNKHKAEQLAISQQQNVGEKENFPAKGRGSLFKRKAARRAKSLGKDHWEEVIFSGLTTKYPAYERVILTEPGFIRPVVIFGAIADIARERLKAMFPDKFEFPQTGKGLDEDKKLKSGIIRLGAIRDAIAKRRHCLLDVTPHHVDRLNYAQYCPITVFLKPESKQAVKEIRSKYRGHSKNPKKVFEHNEKLEKFYSHLFTSILPHNTTESWFPRLCETIESQQRRQIWMSEKKPEDDISDDFLFPMPNRLSFAGSPESDMDLSRAQDDLDMSPMQKKRLVRSSSDPSINTMDKIPGIPPYPSPPSYNMGSPQDRYSRPDNQLRSQDANEIRPEDRYYPSYYGDSMPRQSHSRANIDPYATLTPSERLRSRMQDGQGKSHDLPQDRLGPHRDRYGSADLYHADFVPNKPAAQHNSPSHPPPVHSHEPRAHNDSSSHSSDSYSKYVSHPSNKHDDTKLREKFGAMGLSGRERSPGHDPYRFTRSTANPVEPGRVDKTKILDISAKFRKEDQKPVSPTSTHSPGVRQDGPGVKKKEPPPVPVKTYTLKERSAEIADRKMRNYENSNRGYNYSTVHTSSPNRHGDRSRDSVDQSRYPSNPADGLPEPPYEYVAIHHSNGPVKDLRHKSDNHLDRIRHDPDPYDARFRGDYSSGKAFANQMYMDHKELDRVRSARDVYRSANGGDSDTFPPPPPLEHSYARPRTNDEILDKRLRLRAKSEPGLADTDRNPTSQKEKHISWNLEPQENFEAYKKLITPGFYSAKKPSQENLWEGKTSSQHNINNHPTQNGPQHEARHSAFEAYKKHGTMSTFGKGSVVNGPSSMPDLTNRFVFCKRVPPPRPPLPPLPPTLKIKYKRSGDGVLCGSPCVNSVAATNASDILTNGNEPSILLTNENEPSNMLTNENECHSDGGETSDSLSTPDTVVLGANFGSDVDETHTVVATARGLFTSAGGVLESKETGVSIVIPPGAISDNMSQEIYFKVCRDNSILPPLDKDRGETLLSPLVMCGPHGIEFLKPVELRLPHCASVNPDSWSFALKSSDSPSGHPTRWQNMSLAGMDSVRQGRVNKNSVSVLVDHF